MQTLKFIFIVGSSRSGTTMMSRVLANHSEVYTFGELHFFSQIFSKQKKTKLEYLDALNILSELFKRQRYGLFSKKEASDFLDLSKKILLKKSYKILEVFRFFVEYELKEKQKKIACFHTPNNIYYVHEIQHEFSNSKFINMIRDNRDVLLSQKNKWRRKFLGAKKIPLFESIRSFANYHPITTSIVWNSSLKLTKKFDGSPNFYILRFEDFLTSSEEKCMDLCKFLDLDFQYEMLNIYNIGSSNMNDEKEKKIDVTKINKWKKGELSKSEIYLAQIFSKSLMTDFNYKTKAFILPPLFVLYYLISLPMQIFIALIFNFNRLSAISNFLNFKERK